MIRCNAFSRGDKNPCWTVERLIERWASMIHDLSELLAAFQRDAPVVADSLCNQRIDMLIIEKQDKREQNKWSSTNRVSFSWDSTYEESHLALVSQRLIVFVEFYLSIYLREKSLNLTCLVEIWSPKIQNEKQKHLNLPKVNLSLFHGVSVVRVWTRDALCWSHSRWLCQPRCLIDNRVI